MEFYFRLVSIFTLFIVTLGVSIAHATPSSEEYWKKLLPNTPMPKTLHDSLQSGITGVTVGNQGVDVNVRKPGKGGATTVTVGGSPKGKHPIVYVRPGKPFPFLYKYAATQTQLQDNPNIALFLLEKTLKPRTQINMQFTKTTNDAPILPRPIAESIPFTSTKLDKVYHRLHVTPGSVEADIIKETLKECETNEINGIEKRCVTSLESMLDYVTSKLGKNIDLVANHVEKETKLQKYIIKRVKYVSGGATMICHKMNYAYGVFYCHKTDATKTYETSLVGDDGTKVNAIVICHTNTWNWNPKHLAFQVLKVKPGTSSPICHFLPEDHIVWISK